MSSEITYSNMGVRRYVIIFDGHFKIIRQSFTAVSDEHLAQIVENLSKETGAILSFTSCTGDLKCADCVHQLQCNNYHSAAGE